MIKVFILVVVYHVNSGGTVSFQEFNSLKQCEYTKTVIYEESRKVHAILPETAFCVEK